MWLRSTFSSLPEESDSPEASSATADDSLNCQIYSDALEQAGLELDEVVNRIGDLMSQFWECRRAKGLAESVGTEDPRLQRLATTDKNVNGAKLLLTTAANRVRQVVDEIEIVTQREQQ
tara:strand:+ start:180 stop:536 length:357 start_codon:yes stop_codon:yes gene_type:complete